MKSTQDLSELLRSRKLKSTPTRLKVLEAISGYSKAIPYSKLQATLENFDRVTLYRNLNTLLDHGIVHKAIIEDGETYYALCASSCSSDNHHHKHVHFKCTLCGEVSCVKPENDLELILPNFKVENFEVEVTGTCPKCV